MRQASAELLAGVMTPANITMSRGLDQGSSSVDMPFRVRRLGVASWQSLR